MQQIREQVLSGAVLGWAAPKPIFPQAKGRSLEILLFPAFTAGSSSLFVWILLAPWRGSVIFSVVLMAVNLPLAEVLGLGLFCQQGSE